MQVVIGKRCTIINAKPRWGAKIHKPITALCNAMHFIIYQAGAFIIQVKIKLLANCTIAAAQQ